MGVPLLEVSGLCKGFGEVPAVRDLTFQVDAGEIVGLLGPNGAGKTTTLRCIAGILQPDAGRILLGGHDLRIAEQAAKRALAYVPEVPHPYEMLTVEEHLRFITAACGTAEDNGAQERILKRLDLWEKRHALGASLSKGMRQKLACACAFIHQPRVYCFDEPLVGLDPRGQRVLKEIFLERRGAGDAILVSTHILESAERLCDRVLIVHRGTMIAAGPPADLIAASQAGRDATLEDVFLELTEASPEDGAARTET